MKKIPTLATLLLAAGVMATTAFGPPISVRNGVVTDYSAGSDMTVRSGNSEQMYVLTQNTNMLPADQTSGLGAGARVTVFAQCFGGANVNENDGDSRVTVANSHACYALAVVVRAPAGAIGTITTPAQTGATPAVTATPGSGALPPAATSTPMPGVNTYGNTLT